MARKPAATAATPAIEQAPVPAPAAQAAPAGPFERTVAALKDSAAGAVAGHETTHDKVKNTMEKAVKSAEELVSFSQGNFEAMMQAGQIWAAGVQDLHKTFAATAQAQVEAAMGTFKALSSVKSLKEAMDLQTTLARASLETAVSESGKITDASMKLAEQAMAPLTARVTLAVEKFARVG